MKTKTSVVLLMLSMILLIFAGCCKSRKHETTNVELFKLTSDNLSGIISKIKELNPAWDGTYSVISEAGEFIGLDFSASPSSNVSHVAIDNLSPLSEYNLTILRIPNSRLSDILFLRNSNLVELDISHSEVKTINPLQTNKLRKLNIADTQIRDISNLRKSNLEELDITGNKHIKDISTLCEIKSLACLKMQGVCPSVKIDIGSMHLTLLYVSPLGTVAFYNMTYPDSLQELTIRDIDIDIEYAYDNHITPLESEDIKSTNKLTKLQKLSLGGTIAFPDHFLASPFLTEVNLYGSRFPNTRLHIPSKSLKKLNLQYTNIDSLEGIDLSNVMELNISNTSIKDIPELQKVTCLLVSDSDVSSLASVGNCCEKLDISNSKNDRIPQNLCNSLRDLIMRNAIVSDLSFLQKADKLETLDISQYTKDLEISAIIPSSAKRLTMTSCMLPKDTLEIPDSVRLNHLNISGNKGLKELQMNASELSTLGISNTGISHLSFLPPGGIRNIYASHGNITSLSGIIGSNTKKLDISHCNIESFEPLQTTTITDLNVSFSNFAEKDLKFIPMDSIRMLNVAGTGIHKLPKAMHDKISYVLYE
jgi:Leucine-rich repeat (LRR) protein